MNTKTLTLLGTILLALSIMSTSLSAKQKPFLIHGQLPHLTKNVMQLWDDEDLALTPQQQKKLKKIRMRTVGGLATIKGEVFPLEAEIVQASAKGIDPETMEDELEKLAELRAEATMLHLRCIYDTRAVLSKKQLLLIE